jgi:uncharacterized cupredoxin-like copper-binding protein
MLKIKKSLKSILAFNAAIGAIAMMTVAAQAGPGGKGHGHDQSQQGMGGNMGHAMPGGMPGNAMGQGGQMNHNMPGGMPGDKANVSRTVLIIAKDNKFNLKKIQVKDGETIRFVIKNKGKLVHEMTIGTPEMQKAHQSEMMKMMDAGHLTADKIHGKMDHNHGNSALVEPGKTGEVIWMFHKAATLEFGCNVPGHYDAGMKGSFVIGG